ncbi:protein nlrc3 [Chrysochromulina tobinii]|uniref:Protein nlrc3 n=1 Tax=Chrysochromulina tobinii TaxID=1460289 RepID=A0A0M0JS68_9EUKA|nr:protein nlrc3 [Chrysochromulina tobinii]|eukprot:KOO29439.1 protein nlrc3 [Chrysochromulina sp. CCMP291]
MEAANYLYASEAFKVLATELFRRADGLDVHALCEMFCVRNEETIPQTAHALMLAEPLFEPEGDGAPEESSQEDDKESSSSMVAPPPLRHSVASQLGSEDAIRAALEYAPTALLRTLKAVSSAWKLRARHQLCSRVCPLAARPLDDAGRPATVPKRREDVTAIDVEYLIGEGCPWEVAAAGQMLPGLTKLLGYGFTVDVAAVRQAELGAEGEGDEDHDEDHDVRDTLSRVLCQEALRACIAPEEGEVPQKLLLAAVALAASGTIGGIPVQQLREGSVKELDLRDCHLGHVATRLLAMMLPINGALTEVNLDGYALPIKKLKGTEPVESLDLSNKRLGVASAIVIASLIGVNGALTTINLSKNMLCGVDIWGRGTLRGTYTAEGITAIADAMRVNGGLTVANLLLNQLDAESAKMLAEVAKQKGISLCGIQRDQTTADFSTADFSDQFLKPPDAILLASDLSQAVVTGGLTSINMSGNHLTDSGRDMTGIKELAAALGVDGALTSLDLSNNALCGVVKGLFGTVSGTYTEEGITAIAEALRINGALTSVKLRGNKLGDEGWGAIFAAICGNKDSKIMSMDASSENIGPAGVKLIAEALRTSVTGSLALANLLGNQLDVESAKMLAEVAKQKGISLCGIQRDQTTADFSNQGLREGNAILLASDLSQAGVTGALIKLSIYGNHVGDEGVGAICEAIQSNKETQLATINMGQIGIGPVGAKSVAAMVAVTSTLTECNVRGNFLDSESAKKLAKIGNEKGTMLFGIKRDQKEANFANLGLGPADAILISSDLAIGALTVVNLLGNRLDAESAKTLAEVAKQKGISLCGIRRDQTNADFFGNGLQPPDAILLASDLSQAVVTGSLKVTDLLHNQLDAESAKMLAEVAKQKGISLCGIQRSQTTADFSKQSLKPPDAMLLASDLSQAGVTGALTHLSLVDNIKLGDEGVEALSVAIEQSMSLSKLDLSNSVSSTIFGPKGATALAKALAINSSLTQIELQGNYLGGKGAKAVADALRVNSSLRKGMPTGTYNAEGITAVADALRVNSSLTSLDLSNNALCGVQLTFGSDTGTYTAEGITAIADALRVNGGLTALDLSSNSLKDEGVSAVCEAIQSNKETKLASLNFKDNSIGPVGAKSVAAMVAVTSSLTECNLNYNSIDSEGKASIRNAVQGKAGFELRI